MTRVLLEQRANRFFVSCQGHATGNQDVCAAASCLVYTLAGWLRNQPGVKAIKAELDEDASAAFEFCGGDSAQVAFDLICTGFLQLELTSPEHISVTLNVI